MTGRAERIALICKEADEIFSHIVEEMEKVYLLLVQGRVDHIPEQDRIGLLFTIQNPFSKTPIPIGLAAERGFAAAAEVLLRFSPFLMGRVSHRELITSLKASFSRIVLQREMRVDPKIAGCILKTASILARRRITKCISVYFPCRFVTTNTVSPFCIGPVTFLPYPQFEVMTLTRAEAYFSSNDHVLSIFRSFCSEFAWIAKITVYNCSNDIVQEKAERALLLAISCLKLIFTHHISHAFAPAGGIWYAKHTAVLLEDLTGRFSTQVDPGRGEAWIEKHDLGEGLRTNRVVLRAIGSLIHRAIENQGELPSIYERVVKCLNWFECAVSENSPTSAILLYELSLEVLLLTKDKGKKNQICRRGSLICSWDDPASASKWKKELEHLWDVRGKIAHGKIASRDPKLRNDLDRVYEVTSQTIAYGLFWMHHVSQEDSNMPAERLHAKFDRELERFLRHGK